MLTPDSYYKNGAALVLYMLTLKPKELGLERWRTLELLKKSQRLHNVNPRNLVYFKYSVTFHIEGGLSHEKINSYYY